MRETTKNTKEHSAPRIIPHSFMAKSAHWGFLVVFAYGVIKQVDEVEELEDFALLREEIIFAIIFLLLLVARFIYMHSTRPTVLPDDTPKRILVLARTVHLAMYASLAMIAFTGLTIGGLYWSGIKEGGLLETVLLLHEIMFWTSVNLIVLHIAGAIYHRNLRDGVWNAMVPFWREKARSEKSSPNGSMSK